MIKNSYRIFYKEGKDRFDYLSVYVHLPEVTFGRFGCMSDEPFGWDRKSVFVLDFDSALLMKKDPDFFYFSFKVLGFGFTISRQSGWED